MRRSLAALVWFAALGWTGCTATDVFVCVSDDDCNSSPGGQCEGSGYCSFPDAECQTGQRYGAAAGDGLSERCVPPEEDGTGSESTTTGADTTATVSTFSTTTPPPPTSSTSQGVTTQDITLSTTDNPSTTTTTTTDPTGSDSSTSAGTTTSGDPSTTAGSESSTGTADGCEEQLFDGFDGATLGPEWMTKSDGISVMDSNFRVEFGPEEGDFHYAVSTATHPGERVEVAIDIEQPPSEDYSQLVVAFGEAESFSSVDLLVDGSYLSARQWTSAKDFIDHASLLFDPVAHRFLRIREADGQVFFEHSPDGINYSTMHALDFDISGWTGRIWLGAGCWAVNPAQDVALVDSVRICALP